MTEDQHILPTNTILEEDFNISYYYAQIYLPTNMVIGVSESHSEIIQDDMIQIKEYDTTLLGKIHKDGDFIMPPDNKTYLHISSPTNPLSINTDITINAEVKDSSGLIVPFNGTYYVPVIRSSDNIQATLLVVEFINGSANITFQIKESGIYTINLDKISPKPTAILQSDVILIVLGGK